MSRMAPNEIGIGDSRLFTLFPCLGFLFLGPTDGQGTQSAPQRASELAEE